jgi:hypothetical protein
MSRVFGFVERWFAETEQKRANRGRGKKIPETRRRKRAGGHFETGLWPTQRGSALSEYGPALWQTRAH